MRGSSSFDYDVAVIGGGSAGYAAARTATDSKLRTVVIEGGKEVGGLCILRGCMPSKALLHAAHVLHQARSGKTWGLKIPKVGFDFKGVMARKAEMIADFANYRQEQLEKGRFTFLRALARFEDPHTLALTPLPSQRKQRVPKTITAKHFVITTGSTIAPSPLPHLREVGFLTSDQALSLEKLPKSLIVLGGGAIAVELAQFFARFDVEVTVLQRSEHLLRDFDIDAAQVLAKVFRRENIRVISNTRLLGAKCRGRLKELEFEHEGSKRKIAAHEILFALGRIPNTGSLCLDKAHVEAEYGRIVTTLEMQTSAPHIYAAGDCSGPYEIVHIGIEQGEIAAHNIAHPDRKRAIDYRLLASVVFTDPQIATVGLTEREASARGVPFLAASYPFSDHGKSMIMDAKDGFVKLLANPQTGEIIGGACVGPVAGELIHEIIAAMHNHMTVKQLAAMPHYHPTLAEIWTYPASELAELIGP
jgi:pyruvate/2-oxoglutarate dehydrogenase complex dihydrolipoamide dehydrogenase (E3) component